MSRKKLNIKVPGYTLEEELFNSISHGLGALLSIPALVLMVLRAHSVLAEVCVSLFGASMIVLYTVSCVYHSLSRNLEGKKVLRVIDHCNVYLLVFGTYIPVALLGVGGTLGWILFGITAFFSVLGITMTAINLDGTNKFQVGCHLVNGWSIIAGVPRLLQTIGTAGLFWLVCGGVLYSAGSVIYSLGAEKKFSHSVFHLFCIAGTFCHFWCVYRYLIG